MNIMFEGSFDDLKKTETRVMSSCSSWGHPSKRIVDITHADGSVKNFSHFSFEHFVFLEWSIAERQHPLSYVLPTTNSVEIDSTCTYEHAVKYPHTFAISTARVNGGLHSDVTVYMVEDNSSRGLTYRDGHSNEHGTIKSLRVYKIDAQIEEINRSTKPFLHQDIVNIVTSYFA